MGYGTFKVFVLKVTNIQQHQIINKYVTSSIIFCLFYYYEQWVDFTQVQT